MHVINPVLIFRLKVLNYNLIFLINFHGKNNRKTNPTNKAF
jgi:hypothetical protein